MIGAVVGPTEGDDEAGATGASVGADDLSGEAVGAVTGVDGLFAVGYYWVNSDREYEKIGIIMRGKRGK